MKIRSSLTDQSLYRQRQRKNVGFDPVRRLLTLVLALVLVLMLMQRAGDPKVYRKLFHRLGIPMSTTGVTEVTIDPKSLPVASSEAEIDNEGWEGVEDGTVWRSADFQPLYRSLASVAGDQPIPGNPVYVGVIPLVQQSIVYRGRRVRMTGEVVQASRVEAEPNDYGIGEYWMVWLKPIDGSERPFVVCAPSVVPRIAAITEHVPDREGPMVDADGYFLKRYLYRSVGGSDQAPLLIARLTTEESSRATSVTKLSAADVREQFGWAIVVAAAIALLLSIAFFFFSRRNDRYHRALRGHAPSPAQDLFEEIESKV